MTTRDESEDISMPGEGETTDQTRDDQPQFFSDLPHFELIADVSHQRALARARELRPVLAEKRRLHQEEERQRALADPWEWIDPEEPTFG